MSHKKIWAILPLALLCACSSKYSGSADSTPAPTAKANNTVSADSVNFSTDITSPSRKIIRTAYFHCRVDNVYTATSKLEDMVKATGGIVQESKMETTMGEQKTLNYKPDSLKHVQVYQTTSNLTLRVPVAALDSFIHAVPAMSAFIAERSLKQDDVTLKFLSNSLKNEPGKNDYAGHALKQAKKTNDVITAGQYEADKKEQTINRKVENLQMLEDVSYATVNITFFQPEQVDAHIIVNADYYTRPTFGTQFLSALNEGWQSLRGFLVGLVSIWPFLLLIVAAIFAIRKIWWKKWDEVTNKI